MAIRHDDSIDTLIVIPTCADPSVLVQTCRRLFLHLAGTRTRVVLSVNPPDRTKADQALVMVRAVWAAAPPEVRGHCELIVREAPGPVGFARAVNLGLQAGTVDGFPRTVILLNDDVDVVAGWISGIRSAFTSETVRQWSEPDGPGGHPPDRSAADYGRIGIVGPCSNEVAGIQRVPLSGRQEEAVWTDLDGLAYGFRQRNSGNVIAADFVSGFCVALSRECLQDLVEWVVDGFTDRPTSATRSDPLYEVEHVIGPDGEPPRPTIFDERFGVGGFEDNDLCVRAELAGWRCAVAGDTFVRHRGHQTLDTHFPGALRGLANRLTYYEKWAEDPRVTGRRLVAVYRVRLTFCQDVNLLRSSLIKAAKVCDGIAILITANPLEICDAWDWRIGQRALGPLEREWLQACDGADGDGVVKATQDWLVGLVASVKGSRVGPDDCAVDLWRGRFDERRERNRSIELGESLGPDWLISVDHDEVLEDRVGREHLERLMSHPDPMVRAWDFGWLSHWDTPRLVRVDKPWADGVGYTSSMRGYRMWRVCRAAPRRILAGNESGLHCGNVPQHDPLAVRVSGIRWRHFGYLREQDRSFKLARYRAIDPSPDAALTGNSAGYEHLTHEESMRLSPYCASDGIALTMLLHEGEAVEDVARWLDLTHGLVDAQVLVWTDAVTDDDDGPGADVVRIAEIHSAEWVMHENHDDLAACRNAGLDAVTGRAGVAWALVVDPDEAFEDGFAAAVAIRRMAEASDSYGWFFRFKNLNRSGPPTVSENIRLVRLLPEMRYSGRVHEGFHAAIAELRRRGIAMNCRMAPFWTINRGLALDDDGMERKIRYYQDLLVQELHDDPHNAGAWVSLALQYQADGRPKDAEECFRRACGVAGHGYLPFREFGLWHLRIAKRLLRASVDRISGSHSLRAPTQAMVELLEQQVPDQPLVGHARFGLLHPELCPDLDELPDPTASTESSPEGVH